MNNVESIRSELVLRTAACLNIIDNIYQKDEYNKISKRIVAKVKEGLTPEDLIKAGQYGDLKYITYEVYKNFNKISWIRSNEVTSAESKFLLSESLLFMKAYTENAIELLMSEVD